MSAEALPTWQINGVAWSQAIVGNTVYVAGSFTKARPPGVPTGDPSEVDASNIFAFDLTTGNRVAAFSHSLNAQGLVVRASPDGARLYVGGDFTSVDGQPRAHVAAFNTSDGSLVSSWTPNVDGQVRSFAITSDTVYAGGNFRSANGETRASLAAFDTNTRTLKSWAPTAEGTGGYVWAMTMSPDSSRIIVGGSFTTLSGVAAYGMGAVAADSGAILPWAATDRIRTAGLNGAITSLKTDGTQVVGSGYSFGDGASFEGTFAADPSTGSINWVNDCLGDTYDTFPMSGVLYAVSHSHDCSAINEFPDTNPRARWQKASAAPLTPTGTITVKDAYGWDFRGLPYAGLLQWYPDLEFGTYTADKQAAWSVSGSGNYLVLAGEFPMVNGTAQQGLVRFAYRGVAGPSRKPLYSAAMTPKATSPESGVVRLQWQSTWDRDDKTLTYDVYRDDGPSIARPTQDSVFWKLPSMGLLDTGQAPGTTHTYKIRAKDSDGNVQWSVASAPVTVSSAAPAAYVQAVRADGASHLWRLGDAGPAIVDSAGFGDGSSNSVTFGGTGAMAGDSAVSSAGGSTPKLYTNVPEDHPASAVTVEGWIKTTSTTGGRVVGFGDSMSGTSTTTKNDLVLYVNRNGRASFALNNGSWRSVSSTAAVNDGQWHHVAATAGTGGLSLFVDGRRVAREQAPLGSMNAFSGYWRLLADQTSGLPTAPTSAALSGSVDEVAVYPAALTQGQVQSHYLASGRGANWATPPTTGYGAAVSSNQPDVYWRLGEAAGPVAFDSSSSGQDGTASSGVTFGAAGALSGNSGALFNGSSGVVVDKESWTNPTTFSAEAWFKTTSVLGGKLIGFGNATSGLSSSYDRQVCLLNNGHLQFGTNTSAGVHNLAETPTAYNNGQWHHAVATQDPSGMKLYVDSVLVATNPAVGAQNYTGYWRIGGDRCWGGQTSNYLAATIDEVAVYPTALTSQDVEAHYAAGGGQLPNKMPTAAFTTAASFLGVSVDGSASTDPDGVVASYAWNFGDGTTGTGATATHNYASAGTYQVSLTVTDDRGGTATTSKPVTVVANQTPTAAFTKSSSLLGLSVDGSASGDPDGQITGYMWDFGDGATASGSTATHLYASAGTYSVSLTVTDNGGATGTTTQSVTVVANQSPIASFTTSANLLAVSADGTGSTDPDGTVSMYSWDFGDGATATGATASHTYANDGTYIVTLKVADDVGATNTTAHQVSVAGPPNQLPTASFAHGETFLSTSVNGSQSTDPDGTITAYSWDFGDGASGSGATTTHTYAAAGTYPVTLTVTDNRSGTASVAHDVAVVANQVPTASFTHSENFLATSVNGSASSDADGTVTTYSWDFGDGTTGSGMTASHTYASAGTYTITLTVTDNAGATATAAATTTVAANPAFGTDAFERAATNGWGSADIGGAWTVSGTLSRWSVSGGSGKVSLTAGTGGTAALAAVASASSEVQATVSADKPPTGGGLYTALIGRRVNSTTDYRVQIRIAANGAVTLWLDRNENGTETLLTTVNVAGLTYATGDKLTVRLQVTGTSPTTLRAKVWKAGTQEPTSWQSSITDASAVLQTSGGVGIYSYVTGSTTNGPVTFAADDLWAGPPRP